jgi:phage terminase small subunit
MALTSKKQRFADARLAGFSNKDAAVEAGYSAATAGPAGSRLVKDPDVVAYLAKKKRAAGKAASAGQKKAPAAKESPAKTPQAKASPPASGETDPLQFLKRVMSGELDANTTQVRAAQAMLPFLYPKLGEGGKKEQKQDAAKKVAGRFASAAPPKLVAAGGKKV